MEEIKYPNDFEHIQGDILDEVEINSAITEAIEGKYKELDLIVIETAGCLIIRIGKDTNKRIIVTNNYHVNITKLKQGRSDTNGQNGKGSEETYH